MQELIWCIIINRAEKLYKFINYIIKSITGNTKNKRDAIKKISRMGAAVMKNEDDVIGNEITGGGSSSSGPLKSLLEVCPICGKEFSCNKTYHVYTALAGRRRQYYCSYHCFKQRPNPKNKL